ncbi:M3 family metallopeptidase [Pseudorhodoplanes sp.]|uniref:M3 family metallopeptidase n=1 Tax=Pseudorhodoplanes sp. TaxID=1934341 RepID=UPI003918B16A
MTAQAATNGPISTDNPLLAPWIGPFEVPRFGEIEPAHFVPAFERAMAEHNAEIAAIVGNPAPPTFANTIVALENSGRTLGRVSDVFYVLAGAHTDDAIQAVEREMSPRLSAHHSAIRLNGDLFRRIDKVMHDAPAAGLDPEQMRVLERYHTDFRRAGAHLDQAAKERLAAIGQRLASLGTAFSQNVLADERDTFIELDGEDDLAGLPDFVRSAAREAAEARGLQGKYVVTLSRSSVEPFLQYSSRRDLREKAFRAWMARGDMGGATDNKAIIAEMVALRAERAKLLGYPTYADYRLDDSMAKTPRAVRDLLGDVWPRALKRALADRDGLQALAQAEGGNFKIAPWDWRYYAEKLRKKLHDVDEAAIKQYLQLDRIIEAAFDTANRLFGLRFREVMGVPVWHPDVRVWDVSDANGKHVALFFGDYFARPSKHSGAWMTSLRDQEKLIGDVRPLIVNVMNFNKGAPGEPVLLSYDDARTLFHEFGHALHGMLSDVTYPKISGTNVDTDFVELPSQLYEHWFERPEVLRKFAVHYRTGEPIPEDLLKKMLDARTFNQGCATLEYVASALVDLEFHSLPAADELDVSAFERATLEKLGMPGEIAMRHRSPHFQHVFAGSAYSAAYYSYMWSEVLDADAFRAFEEAGDIFDPAVAAKLRDNIYAAGGRRSSDEAYIAFRGKLPSPEALLARRGLVDAVPAGEA